MAISKFLHFWNPRLFIIVDGAEMEQFVFGHRWLRDELDKTQIPHWRNEGENDERLAEYMRVLAFARGFVTANPNTVQRPFPKNRASRHHGGVVNAMWQGGYDGSRRQGGRATAAVVGPPAFVGS
jgi:hypothetical protein